MRAARGTGADATHTAGFGPAGCTPTNPSYTGPASFTPAGAARTAEPQLAADRANTAGRHPDRGRTDPTCDYLAGADRAAVAGSAGAAAAITAATAAAVATRVAAQA